MRRLPLATVVALALVLPMAALVWGSTLGVQPAHASIAAPSASLAHCPNYQNSPNCVVVPPSGIVNITICGVHFVGTAAPGTTIECSNLPLLIKLTCGSAAPLPQTGGAAQNEPKAAMRFRSSARDAGVASAACCETGVSVSIHGTSLNLKVPGGRIYRFDPATGLSQPVSAITGSGGEYTVLYGSCSTAFMPLPKTGGGLGLALSRVNANALAPEPGIPLPAIAVASLLALAGAASLLVRARNGQSQESSSILDIS